MGKNYIGIGYLVYFSKLKSHDLTIDRLTKCVVRQHDNRSFLIDDLNPVKISV